MRRKLEKREKEKVKSRLGAVVKVNRKNQIMKTKHVFSFWPMKPQHVDKLNRHQLKTAKVAKPDSQIVRRAEFSSDEPLSSLLRRKRKEEPLKELATRQKSDDVFRSELLSRKERREEPLPSASDYSDLESPERETGWSAQTHGNPNSFDIQRLRKS